MSEKNNKSRIVGLDGMKGKPDERMLKLHTFPFPMPSNNLDELAQLCMGQAPHPLSGVMLPVFGYQPQAGLVAYETKQALDAQQAQIDELKAELAKFTNGKSDA